MKRFLAGVLFSFIGVAGWSQQDAMYSQYMFNGLYINPAYAGSHPYFSSTAIFRKQWVNFPGAPTCGTVAVDGPIYGNPMGIGLVAGFDRIGVTSQTDFFLNYSYQLKLGKGKLAFGVKGGISQYKADLTQLIYWDPSDQVFNGDITGKIVPRFGFGAYYHQDEWFAGISVPTVLAYDKDKAFGIDVNQATNLRRHYYATGGYIWPVNEDIKLKPSILVKYIPSAPVQADFNFAALFNDALWLGVSYRTGDAVSGIIEYQANNHFRVGYAYDFTFTQIKKYSAGTHEIMIGYDFGKDFTKVKTPRFF